MGSGISTKYGKTYFYRLNNKDGNDIVSEDANQYEKTVSHTIDSHNDEKVIKFCEEMVSRKPYEESCYSRNLTNVAQHFEMNEKGAFGKSGAGKNVWLIESDSPMDSAMFFYSELSEGGLCSYTPNQHGVISVLGDGKSVMFRPYPTTEGSPAVEVRIQTGKLFQKYHFLQRCI